MFDLWIQITKFVLVGFIVGLFVGLSIALDLNKDRVKETFKKWEPSILDFLERIS